MLFAFVRLRLRLLCEARSAHRSCALVNGTAVVNQTGNRMPIRSSADLSSREAVIPSVSGVDAIYRES
ncbi:hypothetical protein B0G77_0399 [Paraburkholderia sp. BL10I2N1]|nr:hypothetical protein B0G77_0399 [Paraburkholderia sp. BL10I2N1]